MDYLKIDQLEIVINQGCEKTNKIEAKNLLNAKLFYDFDTPGISDHIEDTISYEKICKVIQKYMKENQFNLMETAIEQTARLLLQEFPKLKAVEISVCKQKRLKEPMYGKVTFSIFRKWNRVYLSIRSNGKNKETTLNNVIDSLFDDGGCRVTAVSRFIETEVSLPVKQDKFLYGCVEIETIDSPREFVKKIRKIEAEQGDILDLEILLYNDEIIYESNLLIPQIDMYRNPVLLELLDQIAPYAFHPVKKKTISELLEEIREQSKNTDCCVGCGGCPVRKN